MTNEEKKRIWIEERMAPYKFAVCLKCGRILQTEYESGSCNYCGCTEITFIDREERHRLLEREFDASASDNWDEVDAYREYLAKKYAFPDERFDRKLYDERLEADAKEYEQMLKEREIAAAKLEYMKAHPKCPACGSDNVRKDVYKRQPFDMPSLLSKSAGVDDIRLLLCHKLIHILEGQHRGAGNVRFKIFRGAPGGVILVLRTLR